MTISQIMLISLIIRMKTLSAFGWSFWIIGRSVSSP